MLARLALQRSRQVRLDSRQHCLEAFGVAGNHVAFLKEVVTAGEVAHQAACFLDQQGACSHVPLGQARLPEGIKATGGNGKKIATVAGAVGGGYAGNKVQEGMQGRDTYTTTQTRCNTVNDISDKVVGYDVRYSLDGKEGKVRMDRDPGNQIPVDKEGKLVLSQNEPGQ